MQRAFPYLFIVTFIGLCSGFFPVQEIRAQQDNQKMLSDIRNAYEQLDFPVAERRIEAALNNFDRFLPAQLSEIHVIYALIFFARNDLTAAELQLSQALQLSPSLTLDSLDTPPQILNLFGDLREKQIKASDASDAPAQVRYLVVQDPRAEAALRSMIIPGWGQLYKGEKKKGMLLAGLWGVTAGGSLVAQINRTKAKNRYDASLTSAQALQRFKDFSTWHKVRNNLLLSAAGVWMFSYADAILRGQPVSLQSANNSPLQFSFIPGSEASLTWRF